MSQKPPPRGPSVFMFGGVVVVVVLVAVLAAMKHCALCFQNLSPQHTWQGQERSRWVLPLLGRFQPGFSWTKGEAPP